MDASSHARLFDIYTRLGIVTEDLPNREPFAECTDLASAGRDANDRPALLARATLEAWTYMCEAANAAQVELLIVSGFRSYEYQAALWERKLSTGLTGAEIRRTLALPGYSEHHTGRAIDIGTPGCIDLTESFEKTNAFRWLVAHAPRFGFVLSYPRNNLDGVIYEPWHWCCRTHP